MQMGEDGGDGAAAAFFAGRLGAPGTWIEMRENELVHGVVGRVGFEQGSRESRLGRGVGLQRHGSSAHLLNFSFLRLLHASSASTYSQNLKLKSRFTRPSDK